MTQMIQKQISIDPEQDADTKNLAKQLGISQSELIRLAIRDYVNGNGDNENHAQARDDGTSPQTRHGAETEEPLWLKHMREGTFRRPLADGEVLWDRESIYEERINNLPS